MRSRFGIGMAIAVAALAFGGVATSAPAAAAAQKAVMTQSGRRFDVRRGLFGGANPGGYSAGRRAGYGWTNRHQQRVALKKRNQARHRRACRG